MSEANRFPTNAPRPILQTIKRERVRGITRETVLAHGTYEALVRFGEKYIAANPILIDPSKPGTVGNWAYTLEIVEVKND